MATWRLEFVCPLRQVHFPPSPSIFVQRAGPIATNAMGHMQNGVFDTWSFGGSANLGDVQAQFSKSHMYQTDRLFGSIEYVTGTTRASALVRQTNSVSIAEAVFSFQPTTDRFLQLAAGTISGNTDTGTAISDSYGRVGFALPIKRLFPWSPTHVVVSSGWHNGQVWGQGATTTSSPPTMPEGTLFISHDALKSDIDGHIRNQLSLFSVFAF